MPVQSPRKMAASVLRRLEGWMVLAFNMSNLTTVFTVMSAKHCRRVVHLVGRAMLLVVPGLVAWGPILATLGYPQGTGLPPALRDPLERFLLSLVPYSAWQYQEAGLCGSGKKSTKLIWASPAILWRSSDSLCQNPATSVALKNSTSPQSKPDEFESLNCVLCLGQLGTNTVPGRKSKGWAVCFLLLSTRCSNSLRISKIKLSGGMYRQWL